MNYDADYKVIFSAFAGPAYPVYYANTLPGDKLQFKPSLGIQSLSMKAPLFSVYDAEVAFFWISWRAFIPELRENFDSYDPRTALIPQFAFQSLPKPATLAAYFRTGNVAASATFADGFFVDVDEKPLSVGNAITDRCTVFPNSLLSWFGLDPGSIFPYAGETSSARSAYANGNSELLKNMTNRYGVINAMPILTYYYCQYMFYTNWQVSDVFYIDPLVGRSNSGGALNSNPRTNYVRQVPRQTLRDLLSYWISSNFRSPSGSTVPPLVNKYGSWPNPSPTNLPVDASLPNSYASAYGSDLQWNNNSANGIQFLSNVSCGNAAGLFIAPYRGSYYEHWINSASFDAVKTASYVTVSDGKLLIDDLIQQNKIRQYLTRGLLNSSNYRSWAFLQYHVTPRRDVHTPQYLGSFRQVLSASSIVAQAENLGELAGLAQTSDSSFFRKYKFDDYGTFLAIFTLIPRVGYLHQLRPSRRAQSIAELPAPELCGIGWQPKRIDDFTTRRPLFRQNFTNVSDPNLTGGFPVATPTDLAFFNPATVVGYELAFAGYTTDAPYINGELSGRLRHWAFVRDFGTGNPATSTAEIDSNFYGGSSFLPDIDVLGGFTPYCDIFAANSVFDSFFTPSTGEMVDNFVVRFEMNGRARRPIYKRAVPALG